VKAGDETPGLSRPVPSGNVSAGRPFLVWALLFLALLISPMIPTPGQYSHVPSQWAPPVAQGIIVMGAMVYTMILQLRYHRLSFVAAVLIIAALAPLLYGICQMLAECYVHAFGPI
jgi:hypothetical protein